MSRTETNPFTPSGVALRIGAAMLCLALAAPVSADASPWYLVGKLGEATAEAEFGPPIFGWRIDGDDSAGSFEVGYALHPSFALQAGYHDLGEYRGSPIPCPPGASCPEQACPPEQFCIAVVPLPLIAPVHPAAAEITGFSLSAVPRWPISERFSVYGKLGVFAWESELRPIFPGQSLPRPSDEDFLAGLGAELAFRNGFGLLVEGERTDLFEAISLGARWRF